MTNDIDLDDLVINLPPDEQLKLFLTLARHLSGADKPGFELGHIARWLIDSFPDKEKIKIAGQVLASVARETPK